MCINYEPSLRRFLRSATAWAQKPCTEGVTLSFRFRSCVLAITYKLMKAFYLPSQIMIDVLKTQYGSRITLLMEALAEAVHKLVNYAFFCESFCAFSPSRDRSSCVLNFLPLDDCL